MSARTDQIKKYNPIFDLVRGVASLMVFVAHMQPFIVEILPNAGGFFKQYHLFSLLAFWGVETFFALSGLLLGPILYAHFQKPNIWNNCKIFMKRRFYRTLPTYYLGFVSFIFLFWVLQKPVPDHWYSYLFFLQSPIEFKSEFYGVSWTVAIEEIFYILFPLLILSFWCFYKDPSKLFFIIPMAIAIFCFTLRLYYVPSLTSLDYKIYRGSLMRLDAIAYGALVGIFLQNICRYYFIFSTAALALFYGVILFYGYKIVYTVTFFIYFHAYFIVVPFCGAIIITFLAQNLILKENKIIRFLADISYPLYIFHVPLLFLMFSTGIVATPITLVLYIWLTIGFSYLVFRCIETPILRRRPSYNS